MKIFLANQNQVRANFKLKEFIENLTEHQRARAVRYKDLGAAFNFAIGRKLLFEGLKVLGLSEAFGDIKYSENEKPFLDEVEFNIAHSANWAICCISKNKVGIDLEERKPIKFEDFTFFFTKTEWEIIKTNASPYHAFYKLWTKKESFIKLFGLKLKDLEGLEFDLVQHEMTYQNTPVYFKSFILKKDFQGMVAALSPIEKLEFEIVNFTKT